MKRIAFTLAVLALSAGAAVAAPATQPATTPAPKHKAHAAMAMRHDASAVRETKALNLLEAKGYGSFSNFKPDGKDYAATVTQAGHHMTVRVDPDNGQVMVRS